MLIDDLRKRIAEGQAIAIVGAGVSMGATGNAPAASWSGLLKLGIERCVAISRADAGWAKRQQDALEGGSVQDYLEVAEAVSARLGFPRDREWVLWLQDTVGRLAPTEPAVLLALRDLGIRIATTNYDGLIAGALGLPPVTWKEPDRVLAVLREDRQGVIHLHGFWEEPASVVLGVRSYEQVLGSSFAQALQQGIGLLRDAALHWLRRGAERPQLQRVVGVPGASSSPPSPLPSGAGRPLRRDPQGALARWRVSDWFRTDTRAPGDVSARASGPKEGEQASSARWRHPAWPVAAAAETRALHRARA